MTYLNVQHLPLAALGGWVCIPAQEVVVRLYVKKSNQKLIFQTREQREIESNWILLLTDDGSLEGVCVLRRPVERVQMAEADGDALAGDQLSQVQLSKIFNPKEATYYFLNVEYYTFPTLLSSTAEACLSPSLTSCTNASSSETCPYQG